MIRRYFHILRNLPGILDRIERELGSKATKASVDTLRFTVTKKADVEFVVNLSGIINERFAERPTHADIVLVKEEIGVRLEVLEAGVIQANGEDDDINVNLDPKGKGGVSVCGSKLVNVANGEAATDAVNRGQMDAAIYEALNAVKTVPATDITHLVQKVRAPRKPKGPQ